MDIDDNPDEPGTPRRQISSIEDARALFEPMLADAGDERLCVAHLDHDSGLIACRMHSSGWRASMEFPLRRIVADIVNFDSRALLLAHNHPGGDPAPSEADLAATRALAKVATALGVRVRDHITFGNGSFVSMRERGLL